MGDATMCAVMDFNGRLNVQGIERAASAVMAANPVLHSRLVRWNRDAHWEMMDDISVPVEVMEVGDRYCPLVANPASPYDGKQFKLRVLRRPAGDVLVVNMAHAAADAFGLATMCRQLLAEYMDPGVLPPVDHFPDRDTLWTALMQREGRPVKAAVRILDPMWPDPLGTSNAASDYHLRAISREDVDRIRQKAKALGGTLNDALMAAYFLSMSDITGAKGPMRVFFPVNLRQHLKDCSRQMSNQSANVGFPLERRAGEGMASILPRVIAETKVLKGGGIGLTEQAEMDRASDPEGLRVHEMVRKMEQLRREGWADIFISNPGPLELPDAPGLRDAYICYPGGYMPTTCFVISSFRGRMTITMGFQDEERPREGTRRLLESMMGYLLGEWA
jgi:NRPS condensation-like uncharacterized protein